MAEVDSKVDEAAIRHIKRVKRSTESMESLALAAQQLLATSKSTKQVERESLKSFNLTYFLNDISL
jgi:hypothetical protein